MKKVDSERVILTKEVTKILIGYFSFEGKAKRLVDLILEERGEIPCCGHECCCIKVREDQEKLLRGFRKEA